MSLGYIKQFGLVGEDHQDPAVVVNVRAIQQFDVWDGLERKPWDGAGFGPAYQRPAYAGPDPDLEVEEQDGKMYYGACHCGAVTLAAKLQPLDHRYEGRVVECNCSHCNRVCCCPILFASSSFLCNKYSIQRLLTRCQQNGAVWIYPPIDQVILQGTENLTKYAGQKKTFEKSFCRTCGVAVDNQPRVMSEEEEAALSEDAREWRKRAAASRNLNARLLHDVDLGELKVYRFDGWDGIPGSYVNP
jgi:hypothetical protein